MKKALSIILLLCMTFATVFAAVSCRKTEKKQTGILGAADEIIDEIMQGIIMLPEKRDEGVYKEEKYGMEYTYEYGKDRNIKRVKIKGISVQNFEYDKNGRLTDIYAQPDEEGEVKSTGHMTFKYTPSGRFSEVNSIVRYNHEGTEEEISTKAIFEYDEKGRVVKNEIIQNEKSVQNIEIKYDEKARTITMEGERQFSYDSVYKSVAAYDENWKMIKREGFDKNGKLIQLSEYDKNGNVTKFISYDENGGIKSHTVYEYDKKGTLIKESSYDGNGTVEDYTVYENDENGYILKYTRYDANGVKKHCTEYFENTTHESKYISGNQRRTENYGSDGNLSSVTEYNRNGDIVKSERYLSGKLSGVEEREYDESGNLIKSSSYDADRKLTGYDVYGYDENGNRIKISEYDGDNKLTGYTEAKYDGEYILSETVYDGDGSKTKYTEYLENTPYNKTYFRKKRYEEYKNGKLATLTEYNEDGKMMKRTSYDRNGKLTALAEYNEDGEITKSTSYDGDGNKTMYTEYIILKYKHNGYEGTTSEIKTHEEYKNGKLEYRAEYEYDENGNRIKTSEYDGDGKLTEYSETKYDGDRILSESRYDGNGKLTEYVEIKYDGGRKLSESRYDGNGKLAELKEYNENGKTLKRSTYKNGSLESYLSYHYDESGTLIKVTNCDASDRIVNYYEIEYTDEIGNGKTYMYDKDGTLIRTYDWVIFW